MNFVNKKVPYSFRDKTAESERNEEKFDQYKFYNDFHGNFNRCNELRHYFLKNLRTSEAVIHKSDYFVEGIVGLFHSTDFFFI